MVTAAIKGEEQAQELSKIEGCPVTAEIEEDGEGGANVTMWTLEQPERIIALHIDAEGNVDSEEVLP